MIADFGLRIADWQCGKCEQIARGLLVTFQHFRLCPMSRSNTGKRPMRRRPGMECAGLTAPFPGSVHRQGGVKPAPLQARPPHSKESA
jgi:hypothetical protein